MLLTLFLLFLIFILDIQRFERLNICCVERNSASVCDFAGLKMFPTVVCEDVDISFFFQSNNSFVSPIASTARSYKDRCRLLVVGDVSLISCS